MRAERERLEKERAHYANVLEALSSSGGASIPWIGSASSATRQSLSASTYTPCSSQTTQSALKRSCVSTSEQALSGLGLEAQRATVVAYAERSAVESDEWVPQNRIVDGAVAGLDRFRQTLIISRHGV